MSKKERDARALLTSAVQACASPLGLGADPDAVAATIMVSGAPQDVRSLALKLALRWAQA